ncbi:MAG: hypothetical protein QOJ30_5427 [Pseudonocardiales bacterium]|nr:hypothetical protein [Pseudonocardiales bacterium]
MPHSSDMNDRHAAAVRTRQGELRAERAALGGGHRAESRSALALARLDLATALRAEVLGLRADAGRRIARTGGRGRARLPEVLGAALTEAAARLERRVRARALPPLRALAGGLGLDPALVDPGSPPEPPPVRLPPPPALPGWPHLLLRAGPGAWRPLLAAALPLLGLPVLPLTGLRALLPLLMGLSVAAVAGTIVAQRAAADRTRWGGWVAEALEGFGAAYDTVVGRRLIEVERRVGTALDAAVAARRAEVVAELQALEPSGAR